MLNKELLNTLLEFRRERDWEQFHNPRNLAAAIAIEAAELQEIFLWASDDEIDARVTDHRLAISHEVADVMILLSYLCNDLGIDIENAVKEKLKINREKYPVEKSRGSSKKYDQL